MVPAQAAPPRRRLRRSRRWPPSPGERSASKPIGEVDGVSVGAVHRPRGHTRATWSQWGQGSGPPDGRPVPGGDYLGVDGTRGSTSSTLTGRLTRAAAVLAGHSAPAGRLGLRQGPRPDGAGPVRRGDHRHLLGPRTDLEMGGSTRATTWCGTTRPPTVTSLGRAGRASASRRSPSRPTGGGSSARPSTRPATPRTTRAFFVADATTGGGHPPRRRSRAPASDGPRHGRGRGLYAADGGLFGPPGSEAARRLDAYCPATGCASATRPAPDGGVRRDGRARRALPRRPTARSPTWDRSRGYWPRSASPPTAARCTTCPGRTATPSTGRRAAFGRHRHGRAPHGRGRAGGPGWHTRPAGRRLVRRGG